MPAGGGPVPITMLDALTLPSRCRAPCTTTKRPTSSADALDPAGAPPGADIVSKVVAEE